MLTLAACSIALGAAVRISILSLPAVHQTQSGRGRITNQDRAALTSQPRRVSGDP